MDLFGVGGGMGGEGGGGDGKLVPTLLVTAQVKGCEAAVADSELFGGCCGRRRLVFDRAG